MLNRDIVDLRYVEQITDTEQLTALGCCLKYAQRRLMDGRRSMVEVVDELEALMARGSLAALCDGPSSVASLAMPRRAEIFACLNRCRSLTFS